MILNKTEHYFGVGLNSNVFYGLKSITKTVTQLIYSLSSGIIKTNWLLVPFGAKNFTQSKRILQNSTNQFACVLRVSAYAASSPFSVLVLLTREQAAKNRMLSFARHQLHQARHLRESRKDWGRGRSKVAH